MKWLTVVILVSAMIAGCAGGGHSITPPALNITTSSLPQAVVGVAYKQWLKADGGVEPYRWTVVSGNLPNGISLDTYGLLSGTPTSSGTFTFTVRVLDSTSLAQATATIKMEG